VQALDQTGSMTESAFRLFRLFLNLLVFLAAVAATRWGIRIFLLNRGGRSQRWRNSFSAINLVVLVLFLLLRDPAERVLTAAGDALARLRPVSELGWLSAFLVGIYYVLIASSFLLLAIYFVGFGLLVCRPADRCLAGPAPRKRHGRRIQSAIPCQQSAADICPFASRPGSGCGDPGVLLLRLRQLPTHEILTSALRRLLGPPLRDAAQCCRELRSQPWLPVRDTGPALMHTIHRS